MQYKQGQCVAIVHKNAGGESVNILSIMPLYFTHPKVIVGAEHF